MAAEEGKKQQVIQDKEKRKELKKGEIEAANRKIQELNGRDKELKDELSSQHQEQQRLNREVGMAKEYWEQITAEKVPLMLFSFSYRTSFFPANCFSSRSAETKKPFLWHPLRRQ